GRRAPSGQPYLESVAYSIVIERRLFRVGPITRNRREGDRVDRECRCASIRTAWRPPTRRRGRAARGRRPASPAGCESTAGRAGRRDLPPEGGRRAYPRPVSTVPREGGDQARFERRAPGQARA